ncbi:hypothetical protein [Treponema brennaborense]|uniref:Lipoprotein n=1 Tax=Treponema brennaborense (strain DSM 12168 / CIP 105900 / DD5/3) TaxID=906968 RepID=F4LMK3_TREBD|nr:hypothetical protein [Treponema brennaborense]AEE16750.1 hypothetical protein Trebr_1323 [Treponema brennaborense DSM 12168]
MVKPYVKYGVPVFLIILIAAGCKMDASAPYVISKPVCKIGAQDGICRFAGVFFDFYNASAKTVSAIEIHCMIYADSGGKNPFIGSNSIRSRFERPIAPQELKNLCAVLDAYITVIPEKPYIVDQFFIAKIEYTDGSTWTDTFGIYEGE